MLEIRRLGALDLALAQAPAPPPAKQNRMVRREGMSRLKPKKHGDSKWDLIGDHRSLIGYTYLILSIYAPYIYIYLYIYKCLRNPYMVQCSKPPLVEDQGRGFSQFIRGIPAKLTKQHAGMTGF